MKRSPTLSLPFWKNLHAPLPRTPRQSQQLLDTLTSSFRRELDREHPPNASSQVSSVGAINAPTDDRSSQENPHSSSYATDKHLSVILEHPLFRLSPNTGSLGTRAKGGVMEHPMVRFDGLMATGNATVSRVFSCIRTQVLLASYHPNDLFVKELRDSGAGSRLVNWWLSMDWDIKRKFFTQDLSIFGQMTKIMVVDGKQDMVITWLGLLSDPQICREKLGLNAHTMQYAFSRLLGLFLKAESEYGGGMSSALRYYIDAAGMISSFEGESYEMNPRQTLGKPGAWLMGLMMNQSSGKDKFDCPAKLYEDFAAVLMATSPSANLLKAIMPLYHPTTPNAEPVVRYLRAIQPEFLESAKPIYRERIMRAGLDALRILIDAGDTKNCAFLARFLQEALEGHREDTTPSTGHYISSREINMISSWDLALE
ncbi:uncharacterized protein BDV14DRAFT_85205 [Aspergillus stella-maris]|uniref:uncharacterized protein n=1 Tax=Aspergillus stella-maris TaxID=1810926 RepID=UPI003CCD4F58